MAKILLTFGKGVAAVTGPHEESQDDHPAGTLAHGTVAHRSWADEDLEVEVKYTDRFITFSDAVVAIAITLLALELTVPNGVPGWTNGQFLRALRGDWNEYLAFIISFAVIGNHWATHRRIFRYVVRIDPLVGWVNILWLLMMVLTPVAAKILSGNGAFGARFAIYVTVQIIASVCLGLMSMEFARGHLLRANAPARTRHPDLVPSLTVAIPFLVSIPVAFATDSGWAYAVWFAIPVTRHVLERFIGSGRHG